MEILVNRRAFELHAAHPTKTTSLRSQDKSRGYECIILLSIPPVFSHIKLNISYNYKKRFHTNYLQIIWKTYLRTMS